MNFFYRINVRLGEYDTDTDIDCVIIGKKQDCADPHLNFGVEEIIPHPGYSSLNRNRVHDIALIRLSGNVKYSDFVQPICLPSRNFQRSSANDKLYVAGWGRTLYCNYILLKVLTNFFIKFSNFSTKKSNQTKIDNTCI